MGLTVLIGGARSGKSRLAVRLAERARSPVVFIATAQARDGEMEERVRRHKEERPREWETIEEPVELDRVLRDMPPGACAVVDCLTLWVSNLVERDASDEEIERAARHAATGAAARTGATIVVSNEVGASIHPQTPLGRRFQDLLGRVNSIWAEPAERVVLIAAGRALLLHQAASVFEELDDR